MPEEKTTIFSFEIYDDQIVKDGNNNKKYTILLNLVSFKKNIIP
ncbi:hypothetical protein [uncultured Fusobacterium sp.]|nr:hypothetical protein [uncultured Fusobacterium sp.]